MDPLLDRKEGSSSCLALPFKYLALAVELTTPQKSNKINESVDIDLFLSSPSSSQWPSTATSSTAWAILHITCV